MTEKKLLFWHYIDKLNVLFCIKYMQIEKKTHVIVHNEQNIFIMSLFQELFSCILTNDIY